MGAAAYHGRSVVGTDSKGRALGLGWGRNSVVHVLGGLGKGLRHARVGYVLGQERTGTRMCVHAWAC